MDIYTQVSINAFPEDVQKMIRYGEVDGSGTVKDGVPFIAAVYDDSCKFVKTMFGIGGTDYRKMYRVDDMLEKSPGKDCGIFQEMMEDFLSECKKKHGIKSYYDMWIMLGLMDIEDGDTHYVYDALGHCHVLSDVVTVAEIQRGEMK